MGWLFGRRKSAETLWDSMATVQDMVVGFVEHGESVSPRRNAAVVYAHDDGNPFLASIREHLDAILYDGPSATKTGWDIKDDEHGMRWIILNDGDFDDLLSSVYTVANAIAYNDGGDRLLAAVFDMDFADHAVNPRAQFGSGFVNAYLLFRFDRRAWYPFIPTGDNPGDRDRETERMLGTAVRGEGLKLEPMHAEWMGLWGIPF